MLYRLTVRGPLLQEEQDGGLARLRAALDTEGIEVADLRTEDAGEDEESGTVVRIESLVEGPSAYHAMHVLLKPRFTHMFNEMGIDGGDYIMSVERAEIP